MIQRAGGAARGAPRGLHLWERLAAPSLRSARSGIIWALVPLMMVGHAGTPGFAGLTARERTARQCTRKEDTGHSRRSFRRSRWSLHAAATTAPRIPAQPH